jgi:hypothetical protein
MLPEPPADNEANAEAYQRMVSQLASGHFIEYLLHALQAASDNCAWPPESRAFHSIGKLAGAVDRMASMGYRQRLVDAVLPLTKAVETTPDSQTKICIVTLRNLSQDMHCLNVLLGCDQFRNEILELLHSSGEDKEATELASFLDSVENAFNYVGSLLSNAKAYNLHAPDVLQLAHLFNQFVPMDGELNDAALTEIQRMLPVGPVAELQTFHGSTDIGRMNFSVFCQCVYGSPQIRGWWPSLMKTQLHFGTALVQSQVCQTYHHFWFFLKQEHRVAPKLVVMPC